MGDKYQIIDGEHRYLELVNAGVKKVIINSIEDIPEPHAKKLSIVLNETRGYADRVDLGRWLDDIKIDLQDDLITGLPYDHQELDQLIKASQYDWDSFVQGISERQDDNVDDDGGDDYITLKVVVTPNRAA